MLKQGLHVIVAASIWLSHPTSANADGMDDYQATLDQLERLYQDMEAGSGVPLDAFDNFGLRRLPYEEEVDDLQADLEGLPQGKIDLIDLRLALVQLSFAVGSNEQLSIIRAQTSDAPRVIAIQEGSLEYAQLQAWASDQPDNTELLEGNTFKVPVVIFADAELILRTGQTLNLERSTGAFLVNFGRLLIRGAEIKGTGDRNALVYDYRPFVVTAGAGLARAKGAVFENLGFGETAAFSGLSVLNRGLFRPEANSMLIGSKLIDVKGTTIEGAAEPKILNNMFLGNFAGGLELRQTTEATISGNLLLEPQGSAAIRVGYGSTGSQLFGNIVLLGSGTGVLIDKSSHETVVADTLIWQSGKAGITVSKSDCVRVTSNRVIDSSQKGIELRTSRGSYVAGNAIYGSRSSGLFVADQTDSTLTAISDNIFVGNRIGLASASSNLLELQSNNFVDQFPRFFGGDLIGETQQILTNLDGKLPVKLETGALVLAGLAPQTCTSEFERE